MTEATIAAHRPVLRGRNRQEVRATFEGLSFDLATPSAPPGCSTRCRTA